jgi:uncharacterized protein (DUF305 family)
MTTFHKVSTLSICGVLLASFFSLPADAVDRKSMQGHDGMTHAPGLPIVAATDPSFAASMTDVMRVMNDSMGRAAMTGDPDHDFAAMMIPHHQGAVDMAKAQLLYGKNPVLRRLAQEIIVTQGSELAVMRSELDKAQASPTHNISSR